MNFIYLRDIIMILILIGITITDFARKDIDFIPLLIGLVFIIPFDLLGYNTISIVQSLIGGIVFYIFFRIIPSMGQGDVRLFALIGLFYGWNKTFVILYVFLAITGIVVLFLLITKIKKRKDYIPLGPIISLSVLLTLFVFNNIALNILFF